MLEELHEPRREKQSPRTEVFCVVLPTLFAFPQLRADTILRKPFFIDFVRLRLSPHYCTSILQ